MFVPSLPYRIAAMVAAVMTLAGSLLLLADEQSGATYTAEPSPTFTVEPEAAPQPAARGLGTGGESTVTEREPAEPAAAPDSTDAEPAAEEPDAVRLCPTTAIGDQSVVDSGALVLYIDSPTYVIAGHEHLGWSYLDEIPTGTTIVIECGPAAGTYVAEGHDWLDEQGGRMPVSWNEFGLVLQTCSDGGTGATLARRVS